MTAEQITTIITNLLTGGGVAAFLYMVIRGLKAQIGSMNKTIEVQQKTLEAMEKRVAETEKIGSMYRQLFEELPVEVEKWKTAIVKLKDERIQELEKANQDKDEKLKKTVEIEIEKLELQQRALDDIPRLRGEMIEVVKTLQQRVSTVNQLSAYSEPVGRKWTNQGISLEVWSANDKEQDVYAHLSNTAEEDRKIALAVWRFLAANHGFAPLKTIAAKLNLNEYAVSLALDLLLKNDCAVADPHSGREARYTAILPPPS
ncbi:MAG: hypothetical protein J2P52_03370 [Blastocatellia bacterium]|nr:hypothetical protein [Blastocatellia bacterium]